VWDESNHLKNLEYDIWNITVTADILNNISDRKCAKAVADIVATLYVARQLLTLWQPCTCQGSC
jgi:hypothetical protein